MARREPCAEQRKDPEDGRHAAQGLRILTESSPSDPLICVVLIESFHQIIHGRPFLRRYGYGQVRCLERVRFLSILR
jgi:hypothetical protein